MPQSPCFRSRKILPCSLLLQTLTGERCMQTTSWGGHWNRWSLGRLPLRSTELQPSPCLCSRARKALHLLRCALVAPGSSFQWSKILPSYLRMQSQTHVRVEIDDFLKLGVQVKSPECLGQSRRRIRGYWKFEDPTSSCYPLDLWVTISPYSSAFGQEPVSVMG